MPSAQKYNSSVTGETRNKYAVRVLLIGTHVPQNVGSRSVAEDLAQRLTTRGFRLRLTSRQRSPILRVADMLVTAWLTRNTYDVAQIDVYSGRAFRWAEWVARLLTAIGKPYVLTLRGGNLPQFAVEHPRRVARLLSSATVVTAPSRYLAELLRDKRPDIRVIPNSVGLESYDYRVRVQLKPRLIWLRTFHRIYDPVLAVRVLARVLSHAEDVHLTMIGPDKDGSLSAVRAEADRLGVLSRILFAGGVQKADVPNWLASGDVFLNTTTIDNTPVSLIEAMASGLPIVSTDVGGIPYLLESGRDAILVPQNDEVAMADAIIRLLTDPDLASRLSRNARAKAETFGWDAVLPLWEASLFEAAHRAPIRNARLAS